MEIAIIGTGRMAAGLGKGWLRAGHTVTFGSRDPAGRGEFLRQIGPGARAVSHDEAIAAAEAVVLALPYRDAGPFAQDHAAALRDKVVIDITNPFDAMPDNRISGAEITAGAIGEGARVVAAFKTNFTNTLSQPVDAGGLQRDVFYCGDDEAAGRVVRQLIEELGLRPVDCGPLRAARVLDPMVPLMIEMDRRLGGKGTTRRSHWKFATP